MRALFVAFPAILLFFATACQDRVIRAEELAQQAQSLYDAGDRQGARTAIQQAIALRDDSAYYFLLLGAIEMRRNSPVEAFNAFNRALELDEANVDALAFSANLGLQIGRVNDASDAADRLLSLNPNSIVGLQVKGLTELFDGKSESAMRYANRILAISASDEAGTIIQARVMAEEGRFQEAVDLVDQAMILSNATPGLLITKLNLYRALRQPEKMAQVFDQLTEVIQDLSTALRLDQINLLYKIGRTQDARAAGVKLLQTGQVSAPEHRMLQRIWFEFDPLPLDSETIKTARNWSDPVALINIGRYFLWQGQPQLADDMYFYSRTGIRPAGVGIHNRAAYMLGRKAQATEENDFVLDRDDGDVDARLLEARFLQERGETGPAIDAVQQAVVSDPFDPEAYVVLADLHVANGARWRSAQVYEDGLKANPQNFFLIEHYLEFLTESGDKGRAISVARNFARGLPSSTKAWEMFVTQCKLSGTGACTTPAQAGLRNARSSYQLDEPPGAPIDRGLLAKFDPLDA